MNEACAQFQFLHKNVDGLIDLRELSYGLSDFGLIDAEIEGIFFALELGVNRDGQVSEEDFVAACASFQVADTKTQHKEKEKDWGAAVAEHDAYSADEAAALELAAAAPEICSVDVATVPESTALADDPPATKVHSAQHSPTTLTSRQTCIIFKAEERGISLPQVVRPLERVCHLLVRIADERCLRSDQTAQLSMGGLARQPAAASCRGYEPLSYS